MYLKSSGHCESAIAVIYIRSISSQTECPESRQFNEKCTICHPWEVPELSSSGFLAEIPLAALSHRACAVHCAQLLCDEAAQVYIPINALDKYTNFTEFKLSSIKIQYKFPWTSYIILKALISGVSSWSGKKKIKVPSKNRQLHNFVAFFILIPHS